MMSLIDNIREKVEIGLFEFSKHAVDQSIIRHISVQDVRRVIANVKMGTLLSYYVSWSCLGVCPCNCSQVQGSMFPARRDLRHG